MLQFEMSPEDMFWQEKTIRSINECNSISELKEMATLLVKIATMRQVAIKGLVSDAMDLVQAMPSLQPNHWYETRAEFAHRL